ncbi:type II secretion system F family protein [Bacteriovorax sp. PP10]|uniref:Type II secretion system F family protein n=1 Tax=Bacteriovorax antarcticus TaxID=3088717 RepID=A0ABU5VQH8_9BACT|nr:type II secretion system F family protein [Bacteriovorax sp. PP10]MEA9354668.1 type II secretion system F family protein [Bacteriovorax sp. PP10]
MGIYKYEGVDTNGKKVTGQVDAASEKDVRKVLRAQTIRVKKIVPPTILEFDLGAWMVEKGLAKSVSNKELCTFTKQLSIMISAGVPILQALEILYRSEKNPTLKLSIKKIASDVGEGKTIAEAMASQKGFDKLYCNLVRAGEAGGILDTILKKLAVHMDKQEKTKAQIKSAMMYPSVVVSVGAVVIWAMMVFVVPQFTGMLKESNQEIPWVTQFVIDTSNFMGTYTPVMVPGAIIGVVMFLSYIKTPTGKIMWDNFSMRIPVFGGIIIKGNLSSFSNTLATLLGAGVSLIDALDICIETIDNSVIAQDLKEVKKKVTEGKTLTEPLSKIAYFPEIVTQMIRVGEQTGQIDEMLARVAEVFEEEVDNLVTGMTKMIEPLIIVVLGGIIATILVAMYLPMFMSAGA